jgi:FixJ family two-component response regulator
VVVVDDDPSVLRALSRLIQAAGFRVLTFDRPSALLASAIPRVNACMVVDLNLPEMDGIELCSALAASGRGLPAILITGRNDLATQRLIEKTHVVAALFKPVDERTLFDAIALAQSLFLMDDIRIIREISRGHVCAAGPYSTPAASAVFANPRRRQFRPKPTLGGT